MHPSPLPVSLSRANLALVSPRPELSLPTYEPESLRPGVLHIGVGRFHRAHQAHYFDLLAERGVSRQWAVVGAGLRSQPAYDALRIQDHLFSILERREDRDRLRVVGVHRDHVDAERDPAALLGALTDPGIRLVTMTLTAQAYGDVGADSAFARIALALDERRRRGTRPFTVLSCDNLPDNGDVARRAVLEAADLVAPQASRWIERHVAFPASMVDRITPPSSDDLRREIRRTFGVDDRCAVVTEQFSQWVVEDTFCDDRPPLQEVGVEFVGDVRPLKDMKTRLLNGAHCALGFLGTAAHHATSAEAMADPVVHRFVTDLMREEIAPTVQSVGSVALAAYRRTVTARVSSEALSDPLPRLCARGSIRVPSYVLPALRDAVASGRRHDRLVLVVASWLHHLRLQSRNNLAPFDDPEARTLQRLAQLDPGSVVPLLEHRAVFGDLGDDRALVREIDAAVERLERHDARAVMQMVSHNLRVAAVGEGDQRANAS